ncbi:MAG: hypothetical protein FVQ80_12385 [Planctomycetes bacterium]|nr:hypothetical protein [Planctomycetota bacterium]
MKKLMFLTAVLMTFAGTAFCASVNIDDTVLYQQMNGFGASYTDSAAWMVYESGVLNSTQIQTLVDDLFDPVSGIGLSILRQPMGTSDFRWEDYTYDDMPAGQTDYSLANFSISRDLPYIVPAVQDAKAANSDLKIIAVPWSAPAWMKTNESLYNGGSLIDSDAIYNTYSDYFVKFIQAYAAQGIDIYAISMQNEPIYGPTNYPGMIMSEADQIRLAKVMGPKLGTTKIITYDHNWDNPGYPITVLDDADARQHISGSAFHCYAGSASAQTTVHNAHPDKDIYFTECTGQLGGRFENDFLWMMQNLVIGATRNWATTVVEWNIALGNYGGPKIAGGCENCKGIVTIVWETGEVIKEPEYYALGHISKFVKPGAYRIASDNAETVAFRNPDTSLALIIFNGARNRATTYDINWNGQSFSYAIPSRSAATFTWPDVSDATVSIWQTNWDKSKLLEQQPDTQFTGGSSSYCGDGTCDPGEDQCNCEADCGTPPTTETNCTDGIDEDCDGAADCTDPTGDCDSDPACQSACDNDGVCEAGEDCNNCANDCISKTSGNPNSQYCCGDGTCEGAEDSSNCGIDCGSGPVCGDGTCDPGEDYNNCPDDCDPPAQCNNDGVCDPGEDCNGCSSDCDSVTGGNPNNRYCCGNGVVEGPEGDGRCDGNP